MSLPRSALARMIDFTLLRPEATPGDVAALARAAGELGVGAICVSPSFLPLPADLLAVGVVVCTVVGFPSGKHQLTTKAAEAALASAQGASELDMVIDIGAVKAENWEHTRAEIAAVRAAAPDRVLKIILETACLTPAEITQACLISADAGADFVKTSTGWHPAGGATPTAVRIMAAAVGGRLGIKASGGIRTASAALALIAAGATRLGVSDARAVLAEWPTGAQ